MIRNIPKSQFLRFRKICSNTSDYIKKSNEYSNFFIKQGYNNFKVKMLVKDVLAKTRDKLLTQNKKDQNEKTIMVTTWHPTLKHLSKILQEKYHQHIEKDLCLKKVFSEKPIIAFCKMKSIRNYIVTTDIKKAYDQKKPKMTTPCYSCRKTCNLISSNETLKNIHNGKEIKNLDGGNCRTVNIVYAAGYRIHGDIYIGNNGEELRERFSKHSYDAKNRPDNNELAAHIRICTSTNTNLTKILKF